MISCEMIKTVCAEFYRVLFTRYICERIQNKMNSDNNVSSEKSTKITKSTNNNNNYVKSELLTTIIYPKLYIISHKTPDYIIKNNIEISKILAN